MVIKSKSKSVKPKSVTKSKSVKPKSSTKTKSSKKVISLNEGKLSLLAKSAIGALGTAGTITAGYLLQKQIIPYLENNYDISTFSIEKHKQYNEDFDDLNPLYDNLSFKIYMKKKLYRLRKNYKEDTNDILEHNKKCGIARHCKVNRLYDYLQLDKDFNAKRP
jgi:hypothetical protein